MKYSDIAGIAKDIISLGTTAGIKKDILDLQASKLRILTDELSDARKRISALEIANHQLRTQIKHPQPVKKLDDEFAKVLKFICERNGVVTIQEITGFIHGTPSRAQYICDELSQLDYIGLTSIPKIDPRWEALEDNSGYEVTGVGRKYYFDHAA